MRVRPEFEAALLWNAPSLLHEGYAGGREFWDAMNLRNPQGGFGASTLGLAGSAVFLYFSGEERESKDVAASLASSKGSQRLIGLMLLGWLHELAAEQWQELEEIVRSVDKRSLRAHLYTKMFAFALDRGRSESAIRYFEMASEDASGALARQLEILGTNYFERSLTDFFHLYRGDDLVDLPWIRNRAADAAQQRLKDDVLERLRVTSFGGGVRYGGGPILTAAAAEAQATWTGALWIRDGVRQTLAGLILVDPSSTGDQVEEAVALWISSGGKNIGDIVGSSEPRFSRQSADRIMSELLASELVTRKGHTNLLGAALSVWDLMTDDCAAQQLDVLVRSDLREHQQEDLARYWARLLVRIPKIVLPQLSTSSLAPRVLSFVEPWVVDVLEGPDLEMLWALLSEYLPQASDYPNLVEVAVVLAHHLDVEVPELESLIAEIPPELQASIELQHLGTVPQPVLVDSLEAVASVVDTESRKAALGTQTIGGVDSRHLLGLLIAAVRDPDGRFVDTLGVLAVQESAPLAHRVGAMRGLLALARLDRLPDQVVTPIRYSVDEPRAADVFGSMSPSLLKSLRCHLLALEGVEDIATEALSLARHKDVQTRLPAVDALIVLASRGEAIAQTSLVSTLFDPAPLVVRRGIGGLSNKKAWHPEMESLILKRVVDLLGNAGVPVREAIASMARRLIGGGAEIIELDAIVARSRSDRSWLVRASVELDQSARE